MKKIIQLEELAMFLLSICLFNKLHFAWWWYLVLILTPDIGMIGYALGNNQWVKNHFTFVTLAIIGLSLLPVVVGLINSKFTKKESL